MYRFILGLLICMLACVDAPEEQNALHSKQTNNNEASRTLTKAFKKYWFAGAAEISSYTLTQSRYGELRSGDAVLIYVTEDFLPNTQVKANNSGENTIKVLKLNATKNFKTGIYPYSIM
ncbi:MAG: septum formation inhibitor Maf, partial [Flavobacteriaceae bacterium]